MGVAELRVALIGKTGSGKSATGNSIMGSMKFNSSLIGSSVTTECQFGEVYINGQKVLLVDTPGFCDTKQSKEKTAKKVMHSVHLLAPGPHALIFVFAVGTRFTAEERGTVEVFLNTFGQEVVSYSIVLFTKKDDLLAEGTSEQEYLNNTPQEMSDFIDKCGGRTLFFNNRATTEEKAAQNTQLVDLVQSMISKNGGKWYTSELLNKAEEAMKKRDEKFLKDNLKKIEDQRNLIKQNLEIEFTEKYGEQSTLEEQRIRAELEEEQKKKLLDMEKEWETKARNDTRETLPAWLTIPAAIIESVGEAISNFWDSLWS